MKVTWLNTWLANAVREQIREHRVLVAATVSAFCLFAMAAGVAKLGARTAIRWRSFMGQNVHVIAYLADDFDRERAFGLAELLRRAATVAQATVVEPEEAFSRLASAAVVSGVAEKTMESLEPSFFPRSLEVHLVPSANLADHAAELANRLREVPGVVQVDAMTAGLARLSGWMDLGRRLGEGMLTALMLVTAGVLLTVFLRSRRATRERSQVLVQLGDTASRIRLPTCLWMAAAALVGGIVGAIVLGFAWRPLLGNLERNLGIVSTLPLPRLGFGDVALGFLLVLAVGSLMGYFATPFPRTSDHA